MNELGLEIANVLPWFVVAPDQFLTRVSVPAEHVATWPALLRDAVRRCYISDRRLSDRAQATQSAPGEILAATLPDAGAVMSGDFGEIVAYIYLASQQQAAVAGPKKWRLKQDRTKPAPHSDVIQFVLPQWPQPSGQDRLVCAEVKAKAVASTFTPILKAIEGSQKDRTSRLSRTLVWLRERALVVPDFGAVTVAQLDRFINATEFPVYDRQFCAIAVICSTLVDHELSGLVPDQVPPGCAVIVISVPNLQNTYTTVYEAVRESPEVPAAVPEAVA